MDDFFFAAQKRLNDLKRRESKGDEIRKADVARRANRTEDQVERGRAKAKARYASNRKAAIDSARAQRASSVAYRVSQLAAQGGLCAICGVEDPGSKNGWHLDHDHSVDHRPAGRAAPESWRGVLCAPCNTGLVGWAEKHPRLRPLMPVVDRYLSEWKAKRDVLRDREAA
jgi:hypothetical protein